MQQASGKQRWYGLYLPADTSVTSRRKFMDIQSQGGNSCLIDKWLLLQKLQHCTLRTIFCFSHCKCSSSGGYSSPLSRFFCAATLSSVKASLLDLIQWTDLFIHTLDGGNRRSFVVPDDACSRSIHWAADSYQTILPCWKDHVTCRGPKKENRAQLDEM